MHGDCSGLPLSRELLVAAARHPVHTSFSPRSRRRLRCPRSRTRRQTPTKYRPRRHSRDDWAWYAITNVIGAVIPEGCQRKATIRFSRPPHASQRDWPIHPSRPFRLCRAQVHGLAHEGRHEACERGPMNEVFAAFEAQVATPRWAPMATTSTWSALRGSGCARQGRASEPSCGDRSTRKHRVAFDQRSRSGQDGFMRLLFLSRDFAGHGSANYRQMLRILEDGNELTQRAWVVTSDVLESWTGTPQATEIMSEEELLRERFDAIILEGGRRAVLGVGEPAPPV